MTILDRRSDGIMARPSRLALAFVVLLAGFSLGSCEELRGPPVVHPSVSDAPLKVGEPIRPEVPPSRVEIYYGEGDCAPLFPNGMRGTCINNQPCNGFGFKDERGRWQCACFATKGGCEAGSICSMRTRGCTGEGEADFKRSPLR